jgi:DNA-binding HxlR family transcriptional regulator
MARVPNDCTRANCPAREVLDLVADKWSLLVVSILSDGTRRFGQLRSEIEGVSQKMLTQTLRALERSGLVQRRVYPEVPPRVEYSLTPLGRSMTDVVAFIRTWAETNSPRIAAAREKFDAKNRAPRD